MSLLPDAKGLGWQAGGGREGIPDKGVDLLLCVEISGTRVSMNHFRLYHHNDTGHLTLTACPRRKVIVDGQIITDKDQVSLSSKSTVMIGVGEFHYTLKWTVDDELAYIGQVQELRTQLDLPVLDKLHLWDITPRSSSWEVGDFFVQSAFATGGNCTVYPAVHKLNQRVVACKKIPCTDHVQRHFATTEIACLKLFADHVSASTKIEDNPS